MEKCLQCHGKGGTRPIPENHAPFPEKTCLNCHHPAPPKQPPATPSSDNAACLSCHSQVTLKMKLPDGAELPLFVDGQEYARSIHKSDFACTNCHEKITGFPHPKQEAMSPREYTLTLPFSRATWQKLAVNAIPMPVKISPQPGYLITSLLGTRPL